MTAHTFILTDQYVRLNRAIDDSAIVPPNASVAFPLGHQIRIRQVGDGKITIVAGSGVTLNSPFTATTAYKGAVVTLIKVAINEWDLFGDIFNTTFDGSSILNDNVVSSEVMLIDLNKEFSENTSVTEIISFSINTEFNETSTSSEDVQYT